MDSQELWDGGYQTSHLHDVVDGQGDQLEFFPHRPWIDIPFGRGSAVDHAKAHQLFDSLCTRSGDRGLFRGVSLTAP